MKSYIVIYAMPGCLPETESVSFPSYRKARAYIVEEAKRAGVRLKPHGVTRTGRVLSWVEVTHTRHVWETYPERITTPGDRSEHGRYLRYVARCEWESLNAHDIHMWRVYGRPTGPI